MPRVGESLSRCGRLTAEHSVQLGLGGIDALAVIAVDDEDETLRVLNVPVSSSVVHGEGEQQVTDGEVVAPEWPDLVLTADVPHRERDVLVLDRLDVES